MSLANVDQRHSNSSQTRRSSLVVNLSTTKNRSSITTLHSSGSSFGHFRSRRQNILPFSSAFNRSQIYRDDNSSCMFDESCSGQIVRTSRAKSKLNITDKEADDDDENWGDHPSGVWNKAKSAPATLSKPSYCTKIVALSANDTENGTSNVDEATNIDTHNNSQVSKTHEGSEDSERGQRSPEVNNYTSRQTKSEQSSRRNSSENGSPEPIVEICKTSSSSSSDDDLGRKLVRRRTVRRYQRSTVGDGRNVQQQIIQVDEQPATGNKRTTAELTISIDKSPGFSRGREDKDDARSHFRTRQISPYNANAREHQGQQGSQKSSTVSHASSSKVAKCSTITTNRKSTTSHRQLISESSSSSLSSLSTAKVSASSEIKAEVTNEAEDRRIESGNNMVIDPIVSEPGSASSFSSASHKSIFKVQQEEESSVHRESFSSTTSVRDCSLRKAEVSSRMAEFNEASTSMSVHASNLGASMATASAHHSSDRASHFSSRISAANIFGDGSSNVRSMIADSSRLLNSVAADNSANTRLFISQDLSMFVSPDVRLLAQDIGTQFAELENYALNSKDGQANRLMGAGQSLSSRLFGNKRLMAAVEIEPQGPQIQSMPSSGFSTPQMTPSGGADLSYVSPALSSRDSNDGSCSAGQAPSSTRIRELMDQAARNQSRSNSSVSSNLDDPQTPQFPVAKSELAARTETTDKRSDGSSGPPSQGSLHKSRCKAVMSEKIERIDERMSELCKKLNVCDKTQEAIELLKVMIQMIEKAWSVPICGDDLGFKLCNSFREAGGLGTLLSYIYDTDQISRMQQVLEAEQEALKATQTRVTRQQSNAQMKNNNSPNPLRVDLSNTKQIDQQNKSEPTSPLPGSGGPHAKDSDSDILTSDLGLDSTSVESLSYVSAGQMSANETSLALEVSQEQPKIQPESVKPPQDSSKDSRANPQVPEVEQTQSSSTLVGGDNRNLEGNLRDKELMFQSARLLSQVLTSANRQFIVDKGLDPVIRLACNLAAVKSQSQRAPGDGKNESSELQASVGTEILQHLFKHSEDTCSEILSSGGLKLILDGCRSSNVERLRHCASALVNLALYGGPDSQQKMMKQKTHHWLFPLANNKDDTFIQYYACLAIAVLVSNQEIEADVLESSTLDLVEPFVTNHEPRKFAESATSHIHGQSPEWLRKLIPLLQSKREEARTLAGFHFAMEAYIKREQGQTRVFKDIGAVEPLRRVGSSPLALASKFACQALRLIGEKEPHKLSQQVPLWTCEDVAEWVSQVGFKSCKEQFMNSQVDGDLLLQLDNEALQTDLGIVNGIIRRRFLRELSNLKRIADYSSVDKSGLSALLSQTGSEFVEYIYPMTKLGVTKENIHQLEPDDTTQLLNDCKVNNPIHRKKLSRAIESILRDRVRTSIHIDCETNSIAGIADHKTLDVFISYRRSTGSQLASLLKVHLQLRKLSVFIDVERLEAGKFDNNLLDSIRSARNFVLVLSPNALDRCKGDIECKDWVHKEIVAALASGCNIIPIIDNFTWPDPKELPNDMQSIKDFNGVRWIHDYQDACVDKVERFIRGELCSSSLAGSINSISSINNGSPHSSLPRIHGTNPSTTLSAYASPSISHQNYRSQRGSLQSEPDQSTSHLMNGHYQQQKSPAASSLLTRRN